MASSSDYRQSAAELQKKAAPMSDGYLKDEYLKLAHQYEVRAAEVENADRRYRARHT